MQTRRQASQAYMDIIQYQHEVIIFLINKLNELNPIDLTGEDDDDRSRSPEGSLSGLLLRPDGRRTSCLRRLDGGDTA